MVFLRPPLCCLLSKRAHEGLCTWSTRYPVFGDQVFRPVASTTPCSPLLTESLLFELFNPEWNSDILFDNVGKKEKPRHDLTADMDFSSSSHLLSSWSSFLHATPVRVDQWTLLCVCVLFCFLHREPGTEQSTCSLTNQWRAKSAWLPDYN